MQSTIDELEEKNGEITEDIERMNLENSCTDSTTEEENAELERRIAMVTEMNEKLSKALAESTDSSSGDEE
ncbi:hypothetical protein PRIPAC_90829 [Pristionchus pacificus]|uniref:Uncharacterized protein n=1 Tax=Pristionchus pacificus TaxID=54126 RepID=A0A2A6CV91_PRIPA|nr:hypothetical protein PRIPAC_90829 [Pristionchus pacificus]|eukprot:PDM82095.1 hypothetical protein PRIPAC_36488 [Pristionchus pacificus]